MSKKSINVPLKKRLCTKSTDELIEGHDSMEKNPIKKRHVRSRTNEQSSAPVATDHLPENLMSKKKHNSTKPLNNQSVLEELDGRYTENQKVPHEDIFIIERNDLKQLISI